MTTSNDMTQDKGGTLQPSYTWLGDMRNEVVCVLIPLAAALLSGNEGAPLTDAEEAELDQVHNQAGDTLAALLPTVDARRLHGEARIMWRAGVLLLDAPLDVLRRYGCVLLLDVVLSLPGRAETALLALRERLVTCDPIIALAPPQPLTAGA
jgi:hypothetical protein